MAKLTYFVMITTVLLLLFNYGGVIDASDPSLSSYMFETLGISNPENFGSSSFFILILGLTTGTLITGVVVSFLTKSNVQDSITLTVKFALLPTVATGVLWDLIIVGGKMMELNTMIGVMFLSPFLIYYILSVLDWVSNLG